MSTNPETGALTGKAALITGAARRVGAAITRKLHAAGANIVLHYRSSSDAAEAISKELNEKRPNSVVIVEADLLDVGQLQALPEIATSNFGSLDILVNNASTFYPTPMGDITEIDWHDLMGTNLKAPLFLSQAAAPHLRRSHGCIVNIVDIHADRPTRSYAVYSSAKGGLMAQTRALACDLAPEVRVNGISPGVILWPEDERWSDELARQRIIHTTLLKRVGEPDDIARTARFLIYDAPYITGQVIAVDGGRSIHL